MTECENPGFAAQGIDAQNHGGNGNNNTLDIVEIVLLSAILLIFIGYIVWLCSRSTVEIRANLEQALKMY